MATVRSSGMPSRLGELAQRCGLGRAVDHRADHAPGEGAVDHLEHVGARVVDAELLGERVDDGGEATGHHGDAEAEAREGADEGARTWRQSHRLAHLRQRRLGHAGQQRDPGVQRLREVELTAHRALGHLAHLGLAAGVRGDQLDHLVLDERRVDVHHHEVCAAAAEAASLHRDVHAERCRLRSQGLAQLLLVGARDRQLDRGHRVRRGAHDAVDVAPERGDASRDARQRGRQQRVAEHGHQEAASAAGDVLGRAEDDVGVHLQLVRDLARGDSSGVEHERGAVLHRRADEDAEGETAADHDLLGVEDLEVVDGEGCGEGRGDAGPVAAGEGDEERARLLVGVVVHLGAEPSDRSATPSVQAPAPPRPSRRRRGRDARQRAEGEESRPGRSSRPP